MSIFYQTGARPHVAIAVPAQEKFKNEPNLCGSAQVLLDFLVLLCYIDLLSAVDKELANEGEGSESKNEFIDKPCQVV